MWKNFVTPSQSACVLCFNVVFGVAFDAHLKDCDHDTGGNGDGDCDEEEKRRKRMMMVIQLFF